MLAVLLGAWVCLRAFTWDSPPANSAITNSSAPTQLQGASPGALPTSALSRNLPALHSIAYPQYQPMMLAGGYVQAPYPLPVYYIYPPGYAPPPAQIYDPRRGERPVPQGIYRQYAGGYPYPIPYPPRGSAFPLARPLAPPLAPPRVLGLDSNAQRAGSRPFGLDWRLNGAAHGTADPQQGGRASREFNQAAPAPFPVQAANVNPASTDRWMLDVYGYTRQGSGAVSIPQGRQPTYGASQLAANLQWRARPSSSHDPRIYIRAYHALVTGGESEIAAGVSALPIGDVPVRFYSELRATRNPAITGGGLAAQTSLRPAAYLATELAPQKLPLGLSLEAYGAGGYVAGKADTYFVDGQAAVTRELIRLGKPGSPSAGVSLGAGIWGGAQKDARRVDIGPTLRFDVDIGNMPARVSVDYREKVAGDAEPDSGVAATVSTRF